MNFPDWKPQKQIDQNREASTTNASPFHRIRWKHITQANKRSHIAAAVIEETKPILVPACAMLQPKEAIVGAVKMRKIAIEVAG